MAANLYVSWWTLVPSAAILGFGAAVLWSAQGVYLSALAPTPRSAARASGVFFAIYQGAQLAGNLIAFIVLSLGKKDKKTVYAFSDDDSPDVAESTVRLLFVIFTASALLGALLSNALRDVGSANFEQYSVDQAVDPLYDSLNSNQAEDEGALESQETTAATSSEGDPSTVDTEELIAPLSNGERLMSMFTILRRDRRLLGLVPLFFYSGMQAAFAWSEFTSKVVKPVLGSANVPLVMMVYGGSDALCSWLLGRVGARRATTTRNVLLAACTLQVGTVISIWAFLDTISLAKNAARWPLLMFAAALLGFCDAAFNTLITALLASGYSGQGHVLKLSFAHFKCWQSAATAIAFFYAAYISLGLKCLLTALSGVLALVSLMLTST